MYKLILVLLLSSLALHALKVKAKEKDQVVNAKVFLLSPMTEARYDSKTNKILPPDYVTHIKAKVGNNVVFNAFTSPFFSLNPRIKFKFQGSVKGENIEVVSKSNQNIIKNNISKIRHRNKEKKYSSVEKDSLTNISEKVWQAQTVTKAIQNLYGSVEFSEGNITLAIPNRIMLNNFPVLIKSSLDLESIALLKTGDSKVTIAVFEVTKNGIVDYTFSLEKTNYNSRKTIIMTVVAKGKDGRFYITEKPIIFMPCSADCDGNGG